MCEDDKKILEENGYSVDCESPFEISNENGDQATGECAWIVLQYLKMDEDE